MATLYAARGDVPSDLYTLNPATGAETSIGAIGFAVAALATRDDSTLWGITPSDDGTAPDSLIVIDKATGAGTLVGALGLVSPRDNGVFDADIIAGTLYAVYRALSGGNHLVSIDQGTGAATQLGTFAPANGGAISPSPAGDLWYAVDLQAFATPGDLSTLALDATLTFQGSFAGYPSDPALFNEAFAFSDDPTGTPTIWALVEDDESASPITVNLATIDVTDPSAPAATVIAAVLPGLRALTWDTSAPPAPTAPDAPTLDTATAGIDSVALTWAHGGDGGSPITGYNIYRGLTTGGETLLVSLGVVTSYNDTGLAGATTYYYKVTAVNLIGESPRSNELAATTVTPIKRRWTNGTRGRIIVTDLNGIVTTWLDQVHLGAQATLNLNQPSTITVALRPNTPAVNNLYTDGDPLVAQSNRLVYVLLREGGTTPWACRASGVAMSPEDQADADVPTTHLVAYDAWTYVAGRPFFEDTGGTIPGPDGFLFPVTRGGVIIATALKNAIESQGVGCFVDAGPSYGGTVHWTGVIQDTPILDYKVQQGQTVADVWNGVIAAGDPSGGPGGADIILTPIYDPVNRPGYTHELSVYNLAGQVLPASPMAWGKFTRVATTADRQHDGTPGAFINEAYYYAGQGGFPVGLIDNGASVAKYQPYRAIQFFPQQEEGDVVQAFAHQAITLAKQGKRTFVVDPDPMRAPPPFTGYNLGDRIPQLAPKTLRVEATGYQRVQTIPLEINPDGVTRVRQLLTTPDWRGDDGT